MQVLIAILGVLVMAFKTCLVRLSVKKNHSVQSEKLSLDTPHTGHTQSSGISSKAVPGGNTPVRIPCFGIIDVAASIAYIFIHDDLLLDQSKTMPNKPEVVFGLYDFWLIFYPNEFMGKDDAKCMLLRICKKVFTQLSQQLRNGAFYGGLSCSFAFQRRSFGFKENCSPKIRAASQKML